MIFETLITPGACQVTIIREIVNKQCAVLEALENIYAILKIFFVNFSLIARSPKIHASDIKNLSAGALITLVMFFAIFFIFRGMLLGKSPRSRKQIFIQD